MPNLVEAIDRGSCLYKGEGVSEKEIANAEAELRLSFASEYRDYLARYGFAAVNGCELTGLGADGFESVVDITKNARRRMEDAFDGLYVVEQANIDGILIWQDGAGVVYQSVGGGLPAPIAQSLGEYVS